MLTIETITEVVKKELGLNLEERKNCYMTSNQAVYVSKKLLSIEWYVALKKSKKSGVELELTNYNLLDEQELKTLIKKFKKLRSSI